ncbi:hypothetical protein RHMOL_Rhmol04G0157200 [Rhododendron molle]|uniref:Uncharacterized protein n=1 Tax=Rhododendron molle TaxID=49168 RepID=A0ACC0P3B6_RHOML|nr:hypothetical protein RHMOL_Rhmol04G0157200 [Rhododendron molle]
MGFPTLAAKIGELNPKLPCMEALPQTMTLDAEIRALKAELVNIDKVRLDGSNAVETTEGTEPLWNEIVNKQIGDNLMKYKYHDHEIQEDKVVATDEVRKGIVELNSCLFWTEDGLSYIASAHTVGTPLFVDSLTESGNRLSYARICIQIDTRIVLPDIVDVLYGNGCNATVTVNHGRQLVAPLAVFLASQIHSDSTLSREG